MHKDPEVRRACLRAYQARPDILARRRAGARARRANNLAEERAQERARQAASPRLYLSGERVRMRALPDEVREVAVLIVETRREIRRRTSDGYERA